MRGQWVPLGWADIQPLASVRSVGRQVGKWAGLLTGALHFLPRKFSLLPQAFNWEFGEGVEERFSQ